ncbi:MAG TPA: GDSL-type esterase/lipase family protein [Actinomycetes bacterium]|nr:GDSL-type esterase/lipase family protein [Actinomycetes bacterium]
MPRPFRMLATGVALVLATLATATPASASTGAGGDAPAAAAVAAVPALPDSMAAIGDSITQAVDVCCFYGSWPSHSWSTGAAPLDGIASHYERIRALNPAIRGHRWNNAVSGARMADAPGQARAAVGQGAQYVTILMGANDLCGWDGTLTPTATFRAQLAETLDILRAGLPASHVFVASIPNLYQLWSVLRTDPVAQVVWQAAGICPSMLNFFNSTADRQAVIDRQQELNDALRDVCATWSNCRFDNYRTYNYAFTRPMVSKLDRFHPSLSGQATLSALTWQASWWGS